MRPPSPHITQRHRDAGPYGHDFCRCECMQRATPDDVLDQEGESIWLGKNHSFKDLLDEYFDSAYEIRPSVRKSCEHTLCITLSDLGVRNSALRHPDCSVEFDL